MKPYPETPRDVASLDFLDRLLIAFLKAGGFWRYPIRAYSDFERMRYLDKLYWFFKTTNPIRQARRYSGLEEFFERQKTWVSSLPDGFTAREELTLSAVGDLMHHPFLADSCDSLYNEVGGHIFDADIAMANLECPVPLKDYRDFVFNKEVPPPLSYSPEQFAVVRGVGDKRFAFMATATNHILDFGPEGLENTLKILDDSGIAHNGANAEELNAGQVAIVEKKGIRIGVVSYTLGLNGHKPPAERPWLVNRMLLNDGVAANDFSQLQSQINFCLKNKVAFVVAHLHWGMEHEFYPLPEQVELAHHLVELGVDAIIGHHPHVLQPVEFYRTRRDPGRIAPIYYSLGNLINFFSAPYLCRSGIARITLSKGMNKDNTGMVYVKEACLIPVDQVADTTNRVLRLLPVRTDKDERLHPGIE